MTKVSEDIQIYKVTYRTWFSDTRTIFLQRSIFKMILQCVAQIVYPKTFLKNQREIRNKLCLFNSPYFVATWIWNETLRGITMGETTPTYVKINIIKEVSMAPSMMMPRQGSFHIRVHCGWNKYRLLIFGSSLLIFGYNIGKKSGPILHTDSLSVSPWIWAHNTKNV